MFRHTINDKIAMELIEQRHALELFNLTDRNRQYLRQWLPWLDDTRSVADSSAFITSAVRQFADNRGFQAGILYEGRLCGMIGHHGIDRANRATSMGYWLDSEHQGKGIMTACCQAMVTHAFAEMRLHRVVIRCATENHRSRAIPERLGFNLEGIERQSEWLYDHFVDLTVYAKLREDAEVHHAESRS